MYPGLDIYTKINAVREVIQTENKKHIKGLILGKNKPWTEIWTPMRKMHFYRCIGQLAVHITLFGWCVLGGWRVDGVEV